MSPSVHTVGLCLLMGLIFSLLALPTRGDDDDDDSGDCPYGNITLKNREVATSVPECCMQLVCCNGTIVRSYVDYEHPTRHLTEDPCHHAHEHRRSLRHHHPGHGNHSGNHSHHHDRRRCCEWKGNVYPEGYVLNATDSCFKLMCHMGHWDFENMIYEECGHCMIYDDPHLNTYDGYDYDWQGRCNYSLTQKGMSYDPEFGVFAAFDPCFLNTTPSCLSKAIFKNDKHTDIELNANNIFKVIINGGEEFTIDDNHGLTQLLTPDMYHPVLAFRFNYTKKKECAVLIGSSGLTVMLCPFHMSIWASPHLKNQLGGLCGNFSGDVTDDFTTREGVVEELEYNPVDFPLSWLTEDQNGRPCNSSCPEPFTLTCEQIPQLQSDPCNKEVGNKRDVRDCKKRIEDGDDILVKRCAYDLCWVRKAYININKRKARRKRNAWLRVVIANNYKLIRAIDNITAGVLM